MFGRYKFEKAAYVGKKVFGGIKSESSFSSFVPDRVYEKIPLQALEEHVFVSDDRLNKIDGHVDPATTEIKANLIANGSLQDGDESIKYIDQFKQACQ